MKRACHLLILMLAAFGAPGAPSPKPLVLKDVHGKSFEPLAYSTQKATCLLFVAHDCPISNKYAPEFNRIVKTYGARRITFYVVYSEADGGPADAAKHYKDFGYTCPGLLDPKQVLVKRAGATITPEAAVFDAKGRLVYRGRIDNLYMDFGKPRFAATEHDLRNALDAVAAGRTVPVKTTKAVGCFIYKPG